MKNGFDSDAEEKYGKKTAYHVSGREKDKNAVYVKRENSRFEGLNYVICHGKVTVEGINHERAVTGLLSAGIRMNRLRITDASEFSFWGSYSDYRRTEKIIGKHYNVSIGETSGIMPALMSAAGRAGLTAGVFIICAMLFIQQSFISEISIEGHYKTDEDALRASLAESGLAEGRRYGEIDTEQLKAEILAEYSDIRWINIYRKGSYVRVEIVEGSRSEAENDDVIHDVVAARSGYVSRVIAKEGFALVKPGDYVEKGSVLISCYVPLKNTTYDTSRDNTARVADAEGIVEASVIYKLSAEFPADKYTEDEMKAVIDDKIREYIRENIPEYIKMYNKDLKFTREENIIVCNVTLEVSENIAEQKENELAENGSGDKGNENNS